MDRGSLKVLIVEDSADDTELVLRELRRGGYEPQYERIETPEEMEAALSGDGGQWEVVLSDFSLPRFSAPKALAILKKSGVDIPFIIVSGAIGDETAVESMRAGAHDFVMKGRLTRLVPAIARELNDAFVRREHRKAEQELKAKSKELDSLNTDLHDLALEITRVEDAERKRFAGLLHDDIGQRLVAIEMGLSAYIMTLEDSSCKAAKRLGEVNSLLRETIGSIRSMSSDLYTSNPYEEELIGENGFIDAAAWYAENLLAPAGVSVEMDIDERVDALSNEYKFCMYRVLQESFQNIVKHASASRVKLACKVEGDRLLFSVKDDGEGLSRTGGTTGTGAGIGLRLMRERIKSMNGTLAINSLKGGGTEVVAEFPLSST